MSIRKISIFVVILLLLVGCIACSQIPHAVRCAYIEWGLAQSIIQYMDEHDREMPNKIEDLRPYFRKGEGNLSSLESIDQSVDYVIVDFHSLKRLSSDVNVTVFKRSRITLPMSIRDGRALIIDHLKDKRSPKD
jgi:hypothetical protein